MAESNTTAAQIAADLHTALEQGGEAYVQALAAYWGDGEIDVVHEPPLPTDRPMTLDAMLSERRMLNVAFGALMPDFNYADVYSRVVGDVIYLFGDQAGTLADGTRICSPLCSRFSIVDGKIGRVVLNIDPVSVAPLHRAFSALALRNNDGH